MYTGLRTLDAIHKIICCIRPGLCRMLEVNLAFWGFSEVRFESFESNSRTLVYQLARSFGKKVKKDVRPLRIHRLLVYMGACTRIRALRKRQTRFAAGAPSLWA